MRKLSLPDRDKTKPVLTEKDIEIIKEEGIGSIKEWAREVIERKLREQPDNDGSQVPTAGNPIYKAMHACNCHSRKALSRTHRMPAGRRLTDRQVDSIVNLLTRWIAREYNFYQREEEHHQESLRAYKENKNI